MDSEDTGELHAMTVVLDHSGSDDSPTDALVDLQLPAVVQTDSEGSQVPYRERH